MKTTLIISLRTDQDIRKKVDIDDLINDVFSNDKESGVIKIEDNRRISVQVKKKYVPIEYAFIKTKKIHILDISTLDETVSSFIAMEYFLNRFTKNEHKKYINIIKAYDEPAQVLCARLYKPLTIFERALRKLVYEIVVKTYGSSWYKKTVEDLINHCKDLKQVYDKVNSGSAQDHANRIEFALEELDYSNLCKYLFSKVSPKSYSDVLEKDLSDDNLSKMSNDEIVNIIHSSRPKSLWDRLFHDFTELSDLESEISEIQKLRNKVMHAKSISYSEYQTLNKLLIKWNALIKKAIEQTEVNDYSEMQNISIIQSLSVLEGLIENITKPVSESFISNSQMIMETVMDGLKDTIDLITNIDWSSFARNLLSLSGLDFNEPEDESPASDIDDEDDNPDDNDDQDDDNDDDEPD